MASLQHCINVPVYGMATIAAMFQSITATPHNTKHTYHNHRNITAHDIDGHDEGSTKKEIEVTIVPLGNTIPDLQRTMYECVCMCAEQERTHDYHMTRSGLPVYSLAQYEVSGAL